MKKKWLGALAAMMLMAGFAACQDEVPPYLVIEDIDSDVQKIHGKAVVGVTDPAEVPAHVKIPKGVTKIGYKAFAGCTSLESVEIPKSVKEIGYGAFADCKNIAVMTYKGSFKDWCAVDWDRTLLRNAKRIMLSDVTDLKKLTEITANDLDGVTRIGGEAFRGCASLESVEIPKSVTEISYAFADCKNIAVVTYKGSFKDWCMVDWDPDLHRNAKRIMLSDGTDLKKLSEITANDFEGVTRISRWAFAGCTSLESVDISKGVTEIGEGAFIGCKNIAVMTYKGAFKDWCAVDWDPTLLRNAKRIMLSDVTDLKKLTEITANDFEGVTKIGGDAFRGCASLESVEIPKSVTEIGRGAFADCKNIAVVTHKGSFKDWCAVDWDSTLLRNAKRIMLSDGTDLKKLTEITANDLDGVTRIGGEAFRGCASLESVEIPKSVTEIGEGAFRWCTSLASVTIPRSVRGIQDAFYGCSPNLKIQYDGTKAQWEAISGKPKATVQCTDGIITVK